jgi:putative ABC transport system ATP-binding protein
MVTVVPIGPPADELPESVSANAPGVPLSLAHVTWRDPADQGMSTVPGLTLYVPPGQSLALHSEPAGDSRELLDVIAGLRRPLSGQVSVDGVEVDLLSSQALDRYRLGLGLLSARHPLVPSLPALDNILAGLPDGHPGAVTRDRAAELLATTGVTHLAEPAGVAPPEQQWRVLIARALRTSPRLVLAEDPAPGLESRSATAILDLLMDLQAQYEFTLLLAVTRLATASRCERLVQLAGGDIIEDVLISGDDLWTRGRIDRIG